MILNNIREDEGSIIIGLSLKQLHPHNSRNKSKKTKGGGKGRGRERGGIGMEREGRRRIYHLMGDVGIRVTSHI